MKGGMGGKNQIGEIEARTGEGNMSLRRKRIVHQDVIASEASETSVRDRRIEQGVEVRNENLGARDMMVSLSTPSTSKLIV